MRTTHPRLAIPRRRPIALAVALALAAPHLALAAPVGHTVVAGAIEVTQPNANTMVINQGTDKAIVNWQGFSIGAAETVRFVQPGSSSVALNRVTGGAPSEIFGRLSANGKVFLVNPAGVLFGRGASVNVGGLVASTLDMADADFLAGRNVLVAGDGGAAAVRNEGLLAAADRGTIALLGGQVSNSGTITARLGTVGLAAGGKVTLDFNGDGLTKIVVDAARINALVENGGAIISEGGQVSMTARGASLLADTVVRQQGVVQATSLVERNGRIVLDGGQGGKVELSGGLDATGAKPGQRGGDVVLTGRSVNLAPGALIDASGDAGGGTVLVGGGYQGRDPLVANAESTTMAAGATIRADALSNGPGGKVVVWSDGHTSARGAASAKGGALGGGGGIVETSGHTLDVGGMRVTAGAAKGAAGTWLLDPADVTVDQQYADAISASLDNSTNVTVSALAADPQEPGDIWINASIHKTAGGDTSLKFEARNDIIVASNVGIASTGAAGALNVDFSADWEGVDGGAVVMLQGSSVLTNGGDVRIYGSNDPSAGRARSGFRGADGVWLTGATIDSRRGQSDAGDSGIISIAGAGARYFDVGFVPTAEGAGVRMVDSSLLGTTGDVTISGTGGTYLDNNEAAVDGRGVVIDLSGGARIALGSGALTVSGTAGSAGSVDNATPGLFARIGADSVISTASGAMKFSGVGSHTDGVGVDMAVEGGAIRAGGAISMEGAGGGMRLTLDGATLSSGGTLSLKGAGAPNADGVGLVLTGASVSAESLDVEGTGGQNGDGIRIRVEAGSIDTGAGGATLVGTGGQNGDGIGVWVEGGSIGAGAGGISFDGTGGLAGNGIRVEILGGSIDGAAGGATFTGRGGTLGDGIRLSIEAGSIDAGAGGASFTGVGGSDGDGIRMDLTGASIAATGGPVFIKGTGGGDGNGIGLRLASASIETTRGSLTIDGTGGGSGAGVDISMDVGMVDDGFISTESVVGATEGDVLISGAGGAGGGSGVRIASTFGSSDGIAFASDDGPAFGALLTIVDPRLYADQGNLTVAGISGAGSAALNSASLPTYGARLSDIELHATGGDVRIAGAGVAGSGIDPIGLELAGVTAWTSRASASGAPGDVRILGVSSAATPALSLDGVTLGGAAMDGNIIIGARNAGGPVFSYPGASARDNLVQTAGVINLRPDDGNYNFQATAASTVPISVSTGAVVNGFNVSFPALGIGRSAPANVVIGSQGQTGAITFQDTTPFLGNLTLQNGGAGSAGILLAAPMAVSGTVTLSSGGPVSAAAGAAIDADGLLLHGAQPEANFTLTAPGNRVGRFAARFDTAASAARPEYGDVSFSHNGALAIAALSGKGFSTASNQATDIAAGDTRVAGDLLVNTSGKLTLAQDAGTLGGDITLVAGTVLDTGGNTLAPGGSGTWRVFADTWVGENRSGLSPSLPHPNFYNCAYGDACSAAIAGNRFIYRAQPTLVLTAENLVRGYGAPNPVLSFAHAGLVNGDTLADAISGAYVTPALQTSGIGAYPTTGAFTSPVGYAIDARPGSLNIDRAALLISVDDKSKVYGDADPALTATFAGLAPFDTASVVTGLTLDAPAGALATAGTHSILAANASAANYVISYRQGTLTVAKAPLLVAADNKAKVYGAPDPLLTATMTGFKYSDSAAVVSGLMLSAPTGAAAGAGNHAIVAQGGVAANYALSYQPGVLAVTPAVLTYVAEPTVQLQGVPTAINGSVTGFVYDDTLAGATAGSLQFASLAPALAPPGVYGVEGRGLMAANYSFVQAASNATALTTLPGPSADRPTIAKDVTFESSNVYEKNFGSPRLCVGTGPLGSGTAGGDSNDPLAVEWSRVRVSPNLSNCLGLGQRNSCQDF